MNINPQQSKVSERWGEAVTRGETGFTVVPDILIRSQKRLSLSSTEMVVLLNLLMHWWEPEEWPFPRISAISDRMAVNRRTVERAVRSLEKKHLVVRLRGELTDGRPSVRRFDLSGLVLRLQALADERRAYKTDE